MDGNYLDFRMSNPVFENLETNLQYIAGALQAELDELIERKAEIKRRRRALGRTLRKRFANSQYRVSGRPESSGHLKKTKHSRPGARESHSLHNRLLRACRIALLEAGGLATPDQIFAAILRRGSFQFHMLSESPRAAIAQTLALMSEMKEARCISSEPAPQWQYTPTRHLTAN